jgi:serine/threonine-protein kinase RsbW
LDARYLIRLEVVGALEMRDIVLRTVSSACRLAVAQSETVGEAGQDSFAWQVVSAVGEAFNNVALHGYRARQLDVVRLTIEVAVDWIRVRMEDFGESFDLEQVPAPRLETLPEHGLGVFILTSFMDEVSYTPGIPNAITLVKRLRAPGS